MLEVGVWASESGLNESGKFLEHWSVKQDALMRMYENLSVIDEVLGYAQGKNIRGAGNHCRREASEGYLRWKQLLWCVRSTLRGLILNPITKSLV